MAVFNKNTLAQVSGFSNCILSGELVWNQKTYWNLTFQNSTTGLPLNITTATITASIVRRDLSNVRDTRNGLTFDIANITPAPTSIPLTITNINGPNGVCTLVIDSSAWSLMSNDVELKINEINPVGFSGSVKVSFPASGTTPADDSVIFLLFLVRSDGVVVL
jgi:hypothetical protein